MSEERLAAAVDTFLTASRAMHRTYSSTATCGIRPGLISGSALTPHCAHTCNRVGAHAVERAEYRRALDELALAMEELDV